MNSESLRTLELDNHNALAGFEGSFTPGQFLVPLLSRKGIRSRSTQVLKLMSKRKAYFKGRSWDNTEYVGHVFDHTSLSLTLWPEVQGANLQLLRGLFQGAQRPCYVDIGANGGMYAANIAKFIPRAGHVIGFEANPNLARLAAATAALNHFDNIRIFSAAVSDHDGTIQLYTVPGQSGSSSVLPEHLAKEFGTAAGTIQKINVQCVRLDDVLPHLPCVNQADRIVLKVDVEGHEKAVFTGAAAFIKQFKPSLFFEWNRDCVAAARDSLTTLTDFLNTISPYDFSVYRDAGGQIAFPPPADVSPVNIVGVPQE
jgi:FkbM family methyltransferase